MSIYQDLINKKKKLAVVGLGYVGMPIAIAFADKIDTLGYDNNPKKVELYRQGVDPTKEVGDQAVQDTDLMFTADPMDLTDAHFFIIAVPTPIKPDKTPNLTPVESATKTVAQHMPKGSVIVYESTVYPGVTEDICIPLLKEYSGLTHGEDFTVGYSPERINPGDKVNRLETIKKIVSASTEDALEEIAKVYELVIDAGVHRAPSMKVAEAAKVVENSQRDINIAFMNELAFVFDRMGIDSMDVIEAMNTKWNALGFTPGLVGGHCIGVDPYYFVYKAENLGYHSQIVAAGRKVNDSMGEFIADKLIHQLVVTGKTPVQAKVALFGLTFKEHTPDTRNSRTIDVLNRLRDYKIEPLLVDPWADPEEVEEEYGIQLTPLSAVNDLDAIVFAVAHDEFKELSPSTIENYFKEDLPAEERILIDVKSILDSHYWQDEAGYTFWRL